MPVHRIYTVGAPYNASELAELDYEQTADVLYLAHENHEPTKLIRAGHTDWSFQSVEFEPSIAAPSGLGCTVEAPNTDAGNSGNAYFPLSASYVVTALNEETGQESRPSGAASGVNDLTLKRNKNTLTWTGSAGVTHYRVYKANNTGSYGYIGTTTQLSFVDSNIDPDLSDGPPVADNPFVGVGNYPGAITFHEQRAVWGRTANRPNAVWFTRSADFENMDYTSPAQGNDGFAVGLVATKVNAVNQLVSHKEGLLALTSNNIFAIKGSESEHITASPPPRAPVVLARGVSRLNPITIDDAVLYEPAKGGGVYVLGAKVERLDGVQTDDLTLYSAHLFENQDIVDWAYAEKPGSSIIAVRGDGKALCLTWDQAQQVYGWTVWETDGLFKGVCVITEGGEDRPYFLVQRTIGEENRLFVERMASEMWQDQEDACYLDCARTFVNEEPTAYLDRLDHLEGCTVSALVDGNVVQGLVVANGAVTLPHPGTKVTIGLPYEALIQTLPMAIQGNTGWTVARPQQATKALIHMVRTREIEVGPNEANMFPIKQRNMEAYGAPTALHTGWREADLSGSSGTECTVIIRSTKPTPMHIAAVQIEPNVVQD